MDNFEFDGEKYKTASIHQKEWGNKLISELKLEGNEKILDLGCGDGVLTEQLSLAVPNGNVLGIDASAGMIKTAEKIVKNNIKFQKDDINKIKYQNEFDVIFSNAALHWIKDHKKLLANTYNALKIHGIILWDFGGAGNCANFIDVIHKKITSDKYAEYFKDFEWPWFMPSKFQYEELMSGTGFSNCTIIEVNRDRYFPNAEEMIKWINQPCIVPFSQNLPGKIKNTFHNEVIAEMLKRTRQTDGTYFETFRRLKIYAEKSNTWPKY
ncbi:MAG: methyltransferase domain-containing protein [Lachnospiraceae bacterium]|jgi:Trans-aconitate methyltransferase